MNAGNDVSGQFSCLVSHFENLFNIQLMKDHYYLHCQELKMKFVNVQRHPTPRPTLGPTSVPTLKPVTNTHQPTRMFDCYHV